MTATCKVINVFLPIVSNKRRWRRRLRGLIKFSKFPFIYFRMISRVLKFFILTTLTLFLSLSLSLVRYDGLLLRNKMFNNFPKYFLWLMMVTIEVEYQNIENHFRFEWDVDVFFDEIVKNIMIENWWKISLI